MRAINHALTGAIIGVASGNPWVVVPAAVASHFVLDAIPHHNTAKGDMDAAIFNLMLVIDGLLCVGLVGLLAVWQPAHWQLAAFGAFLATSPDFMWIPGYLRARHHQNQIAGRGILKFHGRIQWFQRPIGGFVEIAWFGAASWALYVIGTYFRP